MCTPVVSDLDTCLSDLGVLLKALGYGLSYPGGVRFSLLSADKDILTYLVGIPVMVAPQLPPPGAPTRISPGGPHGQA